MSYLAPHVSDMSQRIPGRREEEEEEEERVGEGKACWYEEDTVILVKGEEGRRDIMVLETHYNIKLKGRKGREEEGENEGEGIII